MVAQRRHINRTYAQMSNYRLAVGNPQREKEAAKAWLGSIKELLDRDTLVEILAYIYTKNFPNEKAVKLLNGEETE